MDMQKPIPNILRRHVNLFLHQCTFINCLSLSNTWPNQVFGLSVIMFKEELKVDIVYAFINFISWISGTCRSNFIFHDSPSNSIVAHPKNKITSPYYSILFRIRTDCFMIYISS